MNDSPERYPMSLGPGQELDGRFIVTRDAQGNVIGIIDADHAWQVAKAMAAALEEDNWPDMAEHP